MSGRKHYELMLMLGALAALGPFAIDMYLPGFQAIARDFGTDIEHVGLSLTSYFAGICVGQILCGPLIDRFGRRKPMLIGLAVFTVAAFGCSLAPGLSWLVGLRLLLALGACVGMVASRAIIRDLYEPAETAKVFSTLMLVMGAAPILAPTAGSLVTANLGWRSIFLFLGTFAAVLIFAVWRFLPESRKPDPSVSLDPASIVRDYRIVMRNPSFMTYAIPGGLCMAGVFSYISGAPLLFMKVLNVDDRHFAWLFGLNALGFIGFAQLNQFVLRYISAQRLVGVAIWGGLLAATGLVAASVLHLYSPWIFGVLIFLFMSSMGPLIPNTTALALAPFGKFAGTASALIGSLQMLLAAVASATVSRFAHGSPMAMALTMLACVGISVLLIYEVPGRLRRQRVGAGAILCDPRVGAVPGK